MAQKPYFERVVIWLPRPMKIKLLQAIDQDGRRLGEYIRSLIGEVLKKADPKK